MKTQWYGMEDTEKIVRLGEHETFNDADKKVEELGINVVWIFSETNLRSLVKSATQALEQTQ